MNKTTVIVAVAALSAMALIPSAQADVLAHSWLDVIPVGFQFGMGLGLYDPGTPPGTGPPNYCAALLNTYIGQPVLLYYEGLRYWVPAVSAGAPVQVDVYVPEPTNCAGLVPNDHIGLDSVQFDAGGAFWSLNILGTNEVALLGTSSVWVNYCLDPATEDTSNNAAVPNGLVVVPGVLEAMGARLVDVCDGSAGTHVLYPGCPLLPTSTAPGEFDLDGPIFLSDANCNSLVGSSAAGGADFLVQHCVEVDVLNLINGPPGTLQTDEDHFVVLGLGGPGLTGSLLPWVTTLGTPADLFPHVSNLEINLSVLCATPHCSDGLDNDGDLRIDQIIPADPGCTHPRDPSERHVTLVCDDGRDNDVDGLKDFPADPGCTSPADPTE